MSANYQFRISYDLTVLPGDSHRFFVASDKGIYISEDEGATWRLENAFMPIGFARILESNPVTGVVYAGTTSKGIYRWGLKTNVNVYLPLIFSQ